MELPKAYDPKQHEDEIYKHWEEKKLFKPEVNPEGDPFTIVLPPPNATGTLHLGHATMLALQDLMIRQRRMKGDAALWVPGTDHAAIATQSKVESILKEEGTTRQELGREAFIERVQEYVANSQDTIRNQVRKMGASVDWDREAYTMDETRNRAVREVFVKMYNDGLIYRGHRIVNWDPLGQTTVADDEIDYSEEKAKFYKFKYGPFEIGTARPETKFGDKYIVMHPEDERYKDYEHGQRIDVEWINGPITATIIKDEAADPEFGTGVMTITPAHSVVDFDIAERHNLDKEQIIDFDGKLLPIAREFEGMPIEEAREKIVEKLDEKGLLIEVDDEYVHNVARGDRFSGIIEPQIMEQWFVNVQKEAFEYNGKTHSLKSMMQDMVRSGDINIIPERFQKTYFDWVDNLRDWCISRQIWWGHRIPVWYRATEDSQKDENLKSSKVKKEMHVGLEAPEGEGWEQDPDTLDTWFSSALWTWSTLIDPEKKDISLEDWIKQSPDMRFHPTSVMETGYDILFFWVARMVLMTGYIMKEKPFEHVYLHGLVRDKKGRKMSKSLGNILDPLEFIDKFGADAARLSLVIGTTPGNDVKVYPEKIEGFRNFVNKLWNIARFILMQVERPRMIEQAPEPKTLSDRWILSRFQKLIQSTTEYVEQFSFSPAGENLYAFTWSELADWYVEDSKVEGEKDEILLYILTNLLKLWHPYTPYVTEVLWKQLTEEQELILAQWPRADEKLIDGEAEKQYQSYRDILTAIRNIRGEFQIPFSTELAVSIQHADDIDTELLKQRGKLSPITLGEPEKENVIKYHLDNNVILAADVEGLIDFDKERARLKTELEKAQQYAQSLEKKLANEEFVRNAPEDVVEKEKAKLEETRNKIASIEKQIESLT